MEASHRGLLSCVWVAVMLTPWADGAALASAPSARLFFPHRTFTKVYHFKRTTTVLAPAVCFSIPAHLTECAPGIQPSTTMSPMSSFQTAAPSVVDVEEEALRNPLELLRGSHTEELISPSDNPWAIFGVTIDSTVTRIITDLETERQVDPGHTATLVLQGCQPSAALPKPPCPAPQKPAAVSMATEPLLTVMTTTDFSETGGQREKFETEKKNMVGEEPKLDEATESEWIEEIDGGERQQNEPLTMEVTTIEPVARQPEMENVEATPTPPADFTVRETLEVQDVQPTEIAHQILVVKPDELEERVTLSLPQLDPEKERVQVQPMVPADLDIISDTVDAVKKLIGVSVPEMTQMEGLQIGDEQSTEKIEIV